MTSPVQESFENFENVKFDDFESKDVILDDSKDPNKNFYNNIKAINTQYYFPSKLQINSENFSMIHINIRSTKKKFEKLFLKQAFFLKLYVW